MGGISIWQIIILLLFFMGIAGLVWWLVRSVQNNDSQLLPACADLASQEYRGPFAFFRRHFNGDYSLARSYWVNTLLISLFAPVLGFLLLPWLTENFPARYSSIGFLLCMTLGLIAWFWAVIGTWASANKHVQRGGRAGWAATAKLMIIIGFGNTFADLQEMAPALEEHLHVAMGNQLGPETRIEIRADGRSILIAGGINDGSANQLQRALDMAPSVTTVVISSSGGWIREGEMLADVIRTRNLDTYVESNCASACTIAFLAGNDRAAAPDAQIGFHASQSVGSMVSEPTASDTSELRAVYENAQLARSFIQTALSTPHEEMWYPTHDELVAAGVLTRKSLGGETAALSTSIGSRDVLILELKRQEAFAVLEKKYPSEFEQLVEVAWGKMKAGGTDAEVFTAARTRLGNFITSLLPKASDQALIDYHLLVQKQAEFLRSQNVVACAELVFPTGRFIDTSGMLPGELLSGELEVLADLIKGAGTSPGEKISQRRFDELVENVFSGMSEDQLAIMVDESARGKSSASVVCDAAVEYFTQLNAISLRDRPRFLRTIYTEGE